MKSIIYSALTALTVLCMGPCAANADILSTLQGFTLGDVHKAEAVYAANPSVPTAPAANQCLGFLDATLSAPGAGPTLNLTMPAGVLSAVAELDVTLNTANAGLPPVVLAFNANCGGYIEDLKAEAAALAARNGLTIFGLHL